MSTSLKLIAANDADLWLVVMAFALLAVFLLILLVIVSTLLGPWLQAFMAGRPITAVKLIGMRMRRVNAQSAVRAGIMAAQAGHPLPWDELERASLQGVDVEKVTLAYIQAMEADKDWTFADLVDGARQQRLEQMLSE